jgi:hypothetical protein
VQRSRHLGSAITDQQLKIAPVTPQLKIAPVTKREASAAERVQGVVAMVPLAIINLADSLKRPAIAGGQASAGAEAASAGAGSAGVERGVEVVGAEAADEEAEAADEGAEGDDGDVFTGFQMLQKLKLDYTENERCPPSEIS